MKIIFSYRADIHGPTCLLQILLAPFRQPAGMVSCKRVCGYFHKVFMNVWRRLQEILNVFDGTAAMSKYHVPASVFTINWL